MITKMAALFRESTQQVSTCTCMSVSAAFLLKLCCICVAQHLRKALHSRKSQSTITKMAALFRESTQQVSTCVSHANTGLFAAPSSFGT